VPAPAKTTGSVASPAYTSTGDVYAGEATLPVVFAGAGTAADYAGLDVHGKIALVTQGPDVVAQALAAKDAGAALLMLHNTEPGGSTPEVWRKGIPVYVLTDEAGTALREQLSAHPGLTLDVDAVRDSTYAYELVFPEPRLPAKPDYRVDSRSTATVVSDYRENSTRMSTVESWIPHLDVGVGNAMTVRRNGPVVRTEYVSTRGVEWARFGQPGEFANMYWTQSPARGYRAGESAHQVWWGPLVGPGLTSGSPVARFRDGIRITIPHYYYGNDVAGFIQNQEGDTSQLELRRDGQVVGTSTWPVVQYTVPAERATYDLSLSVRNGGGNFADTSTGTESTWRFTSARSDRDRTVLPLVTVAYGLDADGRNAVRAGAAYPLTITPGYQPEATGPGRFTVTTQVSYDDGATWTTAPVRPAHGRYEATIPAAQPSAAFASVRVVATDRDGNRLTQRIDHAWRIAP